MSKTSMFVLMGDLLRKYGIASTSMKYCKYVKTKYTESIVYVDDSDNDEEDPTRYSITSSNVFVRVDVICDKSVETHCLKNVEEFVDWCNGTAESAQEKMKRLSEETRAEYERLSCKY